MAKATKDIDIFGNNIIRDSSGDTYTEGTDLLGNKVYRGSNGEVYTETTDVMGDSVIYDSKGEKYTKGTDIYGNNVVRDSHGGVYTESTDVLGNSVIYGNKRERIAGESTGGNEEGIAAIIITLLAAVIVIPFSIVGFARMAGHFGRFASIAQLFLCIVVGLIVKFMPKRISGFVAAVGNFLVSVVFPLILYAAMIKGGNTYALGTILLAIFPLFLGVPILCILESRAFNEHLYSSYNRVVLVIGLFISDITVIFLPYSDFYRNPKPYAILLIPQVLLFIDVFVKAVDFIRKK